jgi:signal transduction histidine kinase
VNIETEDPAESLIKISTISAIPAILDMICRTTGMGFATVARVTDDRWVACAVLDKINFGLPVGGELKVETTLCHEVNQHRKGIVIDNFDLDPVFASHHTPEMYGLKSYISIPIILQDGRFFGTLCAIDPNPASVNTPDVIGMFNLYAELIALHLHNFEQMGLLQANLKEEKMFAELREQFIAVLGHDLRNPVGAVRNVAQLMQSGRLDEQGIKKFAGVLMNSSQRMSGLIANLMDFARGRLGSGLTIHPVSVSITETLLHVIDELKLLNLDSAIEVQLDLPDMLFLDSKRIAQLFSNVLGNALSHGEPGKPISVSSNADDAQFYLCVRNHGNAIPEEVLKNIFEPFTRGLMDDGHEGLGLGLFISSEIAKAHGGQLEAQSVDGIIEFKLTIPLSPV